MVKFGTIPISKSFTNFDKKWPSKLQNLIFNICNANIVFFIKYIDFSGSIPPLTTTMVSYKASAKTAEIMPHYGHRKNLICIACGFSKSELSSYLNYCYSVKPEFGPQRETLYF